MGELAIRGEALMRWCQRFDRLPSIFPQWPTSAHLSLVVVEMGIAAVVGNVLPTADAATKSYHEPNETRTALYYTVPTEEIAAVLLKKKGE